MRIRYPVSAMTSIGKKKRRRNVTSCDEYTAADYRRILGVYSNGCEAQSRYRGGVSWMKIEYRVDQSIVTDRLLIPLCYPLGIRAVR
jgi:hypothetical protein